MIRWYISFLLFASAFCTIGGSTNPWLVHRGFVLPSWFPGNQKIEALIGLGQLAITCNTFETVTNADKDWFMLIEGTVQHIIKKNSTQKNKEQELKQFLTLTLQSKRKQAASIFAFAHTIIALKRQMIANKYPQWVQTIASPIINQTAQDIFNNHNPYKNTVAQVSETKTQSMEEKEWYQNRIKTIMPQQQHLLKRNIDENNMLKVGIALSGGGYRAMTLSSGYLKGLEEIGILQNSLYVSSLSGSSWLVAPWISKDYSLQKMQEKLKKAIKSNSFNILGLTKFNADDMNNLMHRVVWPKEIFQQPLSSVDLYGMMLAKALFHRTRTPFSEYLSKQYDNIKDGHRPFPLYSAIATNLQYDDYYWYEFNPIDVCNLQQGYTIPTWSFGRKFNRGQSEDFAPEQLLGYFMGIWGSAFTVSLQDIDNEIQRRLISLETKQDFFTLLERTMLKGVKKCLNGLEALLGNIRFSPAVIANPWKGMNRNEQKYNDTITVVDAGITCNIAAVPYFYRDRNLDLIIVCDSSSSVGQLNEQQVPVSLQKLFDYVEKYFDLHYEKTTRFTKRNSRLKVYQAQPQTPLIVYLDFQKSEQLMQRLIQQKDPLARMILANKLLEFDQENADFAHFINFDYTIHNFNQLSGLAEFAVKSQKQELVVLMQKLQEEKI